MTDKYLFQWSFKRQCQSVIFQLWGQNRDPWEIIHFKECLYWLNNDKYRLDNGKLILYTKNREKNHIWEILKDNMKQNTYRKRDIVSHHEPTREKYTQEI